MSLGNRGTEAIFPGCSTDLLVEQRRLLDMQHAECDSWTASIETAVMGMQGPPYRSALRKLTEKYLKRQIQNGSHDSIDDARAAMELALLKFRYPHDALSSLTHPRLHQNLSHLLPLKQRLHTKV